ncbi:hypothetical protein Y88_0896 [Novosphingobium nitrogenifigens DSM 19370]|uniref:nicotinamidase n=1 Tax=Novosphingobium nitrogenifigens DSM 19370 TaxID=983920 RepID=F1Z904_9SPHN|nr:isochorismatase family protein [Novosphingobium nitrogenifigens]EGD58835.1 hypothetical protein Y88_0896 [Novosphingobium nitrogenifigens DSM 19370]
MIGFVIVVDMQYDFVAPDGALSVPDADSLVRPMQEWLAELDPAHVAGVLMTFDTHDPEIYPASAEAEEFPIHCVRGSTGWDSVLDPSVINPAIPVWRLEKGVFDMWAEPDARLSRFADATVTVDRDAFFEDLVERGIGPVTVVGVATDYCVRWAVEGLVERGFAVEVPPALTKGIGTVAEAIESEEEGPITSCG